MGGVTTAQGMQRKGCSGRSSACPPWSGCFLASSRYIHAGRSMQSRNFDNDELEGSRGRGVGLGGNYRMNTPSIGRISEALSRYRSYTTLG